MKLHVCSGHRYLDGWVNIDIVAPSEGQAPDMLCNATKIDLPDACADEIMCIHGFEHFYRWECDVLVAEWVRLLKPGGRLVLEMPNLIKCCRNILEGKNDAGKHPDQMGMWGLFGDPRLQDVHMIHRWGWDPRSLKKFLKEAGFTDIKEEVTQYHPAGRANRDMRMVARRHL